MPRFKDTYPKKKSKGHRMKNIKVKQGEMKHRRLHCTPVLTDEEDSDSSVEIIYSEDCEEEDDDHGVNIAEEKLVEEKLMEQKLMEQKLMEQKLVEQKLAEEKQLEQKLAERKLAIVEQKLLEQKLVEHKSQIISTNFTHNLMSIAKETEAYKDVKCKDTVQAVQSKSKEKWDLLNAKYTDLDEEIIDLDMLDDEAEFWSSDDQSFESDGSDLEIISDNDTSPGPPGEPSGKQLSTFVEKFSDHVRADIAKPKNRKRKWEITGNVHGHLKQGRFVTESSRTIIRIFGNELSFPPRYAEFLKDLTGYDLTKGALEIEMLTRNNQTTATIKSITDAKQECSNLRQLSVPLHVDASYINTSANLNRTLNRSLAVKKVIKMFTPIKERVNNKLSDQTSLNSTLNRSHKVNKVINMFTPIKVKQEREANKLSDQTSLNSSLNRSHNVNKVINMFTPIKVKQEREANILEPNLNHSYKDWRIPTPHISHLAYHPHLDTTLDANPSFNEKTSTKLQILRESKALNLEHQSRSWPQKRYPTRSLRQEHDPAIQRQLQNVSDWHPAKRAICDQYPSSFSPIKRCRFDDAHSVLSSTRLDDTFSENNGTFSANNNTFSSNKNCSFSQISSKGFMGKVSSDQKHVNFDNSTRSSLRQQHVSNFNPSVMSTPAVKSRSSIEDINSDRKRSNRSEVSEPIEPSFSKPIDKQRNITTANFCGSPTMSSPANLGLMSPIPQQALSPALSAPANNISAPIINDIISGLSRRGQRLNICMNYSIGLDDVKKEVSEKENLWPK